MLTVQALNLLHKHPFIVRLYYTFQDPAKLCMSSAWVSLSYRNMSVFTSTEYFLSLFLPTLSIIYHHTMNSHFFSPLTPQTSCWPTVATVSSYDGSRSSLLSMRPAHASTLRNWPLLWSTCTRLASSIGLWHILINLHSGWNLIFLFLVFLWSFCWRKQGFEAGKHFARWQYACESDWFRHCETFGGGGRR